MPRVDSDPIRSPVICRVSAMLRIEPGVEIIFESGTSIILVENGALTRTLDAGSSDKIIFRGYQRTPGYWDGIVAEYGSRGLQLRHCDISDAKVAVRSETKAPSIRDCTLQHNEVGLAMTAHGTGRSRVREHHHPIQYRLCDALFHVIQRAYVVHHHEARFPEPGR